MREQHGDPAVAVRRGLRFLGGSNDFTKDEEPEANHVRGVFIHFPALQRSLELCHPSKSDQGHLGDPPEVLQLDPAWLYLRDTHHRHFTYALPRNAGVQKRYLEVLDGDWRSADWPE